MIKSARHLMLVLSLASLSRELHAQAPSVDVRLGDEFVIENGGNEIRHFPFLFKENGRLIAAFSQHPDGKYAHPVDGLRVSHDGGMTWPIYHENPDFYLTGMVHLGASILWGMSYITERVDARNIKCHYWLSPDNGVSWLKREGNVLLPRDQRDAGEANWGGFSFHRNILRMPDGSLQGTMYGIYKGDAGRSTLWVKSTNDGEDWTVVSTVAYMPDDPNGWDHSEPAVARVKDGSLLAVLRASNGKPLYQCRSTDGGLTWSAPVNLPGLPVGVDPQLTLLESGMLVLSYGRPSTNLLFSLDGSGNTWESKAGPLFNESDSCYLGVVEVSKNRLLAITDNSDRKKIVGKFVDVLPSGDDFEADANALPPSGYTITGPGVSVVNAVAFSGSKALEIKDESASIMPNAVRMVAPSPRMTFETRLYPEAISSGAILDVLSGGNQSANIAFHLAVTGGGSIWFYDPALGWVAVASSGTVPLNKWSKIRVDIPDPTVARIYVNDVFMGNARPWHSFATLDRIRFSSGFTSGVGDHFYVDYVRVLPDVANDFEGDTADATPVGYLEVGGDCAVKNAGEFITAYSGTKSLQVIDRSTTVLTNVVKFGSAKSTKVFEAQLAPSNIGQACVISLNSGGNENTRSVFHMGILSDGSVASYNGVTWTEVAGPGTVKLKKWNKIRIKASAGGNAFAELFVNEKLVGSMGGWNNFPTIDRVRFMSGSTSGVGDEFYLDDVKFY